MVTKTCPLPYSHGPMPGLGAKVPGLLHDLPAVSPWNKASPSGPQASHLSSGDEDHLGGWAALHHPQVTEEAREVQIPGGVASLSVSAWPLSLLASWADTVITFLASWWVAALLCSSAPASP